MLLVALAVTGYLVYRHLNDNIVQADMRSDIGKQPADLHPQAETVLFIGSNTALSVAAEAKGATAQTGTITLVHVAANRQWAGDVDPAVARHGDLRRPLRRGE